MRISILIGLEKDSLDSIGVVGRAVALSTVVLYNEPSDLIHIIII